MAEDDIWQSDITDREAELSVYDQTHTKLLESSYKKGYFDGLDTEINLLQANDGFRKGIDLAK